jgi:Uma2 family endonuclease
MTPVVRAPVSVDEFWHLAHRLPKAELVGGLVVELVPPGARHGMLAAVLGHRLREHVTARVAGTVFSETGFVLTADPPTVRAPDIAVVLTHRVPVPLPVRFFPGPPDLAVEVLSPEDRPAEIASKVADFLAAGAHAVWVVDPSARTVAVHTRAGVVVFSGDEVLRAAPPLPEFELSLPDLFDGVG